MRACVLDRICVQPCRVRATMPPRGFAVCKLAPMHPVCASVLCVVAVSNAHQDSRTQGDPDFAALYTARVHACSCSTCVMPFVCIWMSAHERHGPSDQTLGEAGADS